MESASHYQNIILLDIHELVAVERARRAQEKLDTALEACDVGPQEFWPEFLLGGEALHEVLARLLAERKMVE
jgi:hypothetical protein